ncbi:hypothetical protein C8Q80DRAFT_1092079 [Daedaleopsis nitida]|nr:hypothetical protein C8Q80DRAFT_1092079 [Daedaleopsis nitida]
MSLAKSWFDSTFTSRQRTEQLLRPDLESGLLSQHDYNLAVSFLPGYHRYLPYIHTALWGAASGLFLLRYKARVRFPTTVVTVSAVSGYGAGLFHYFHRHQAFARQLDDRQAFLLCLENVNERLGSPTPLFPQMDHKKMLESVKKRKEESGEVLSAGVELVGDISEPSSDAPTFSNALPTKASEESSARQQSVWDAIREANARGSGKHSSWDELRQRHERQRVPDQVQQPALEIEDSRAKAQADFDAILEAERKAARG